MAFIKDLQVSFNKNVIANYISQIYNTLCGVVVIPFYIKYMGTEAYGLVGFFAMLQAWFSLLDIGLSGTLARESARYYGGALDALQYRRLIRALEGIFLAIALIGGLCFYAASGQIAMNWLKPSMLPAFQIQSAVELMSPVIAIRWMCGIYRSLITGAERIFWLSAFSSLTTTFRFLGVLPVLVFIDNSPETFFKYQLIVSIIEFIGLMIYGYWTLPRLVEAERISWSWSPLKPIIRFSLTIAATSTIWIIATQTDKLLLSTILPLTEYGYFTLAVLVASIVTLVTAPVSGVLMPRMARLEAERDYAGLISVYRQSTQIVAVVAGSTSLALAFSANALLFAWTGDAVLADKAAPILALYAIGNAVLAVSAFPYYLQFAKGDLRLHFIGNTIFVVFMIPAILVGTSKYGMIGAGYIWLTINILTFCLWLPFVHKKFAPGLNKEWYLNDVLKIFGYLLISGFILNEINFQVEGNIMTFIKTGTFGLILMVCGALASSEFLKYFKKKFNLN